MRNIMFCAILLIEVFLLGCSGNPVSPNETPEVTDSPGNTAQVNTHLWGYFDVYIDIENQTAEAVLNRSAMFAANVVDFVNNPVTNLGFDIYGTPTGSGYVDVDIDVSITHPFPGMNMYNGYDVRGIFMGEGSGTMTYESLNFPEYGSDQVMYDYDETDSDPYDGLVGMPDGYTRWFNADEFTEPGLFGYTQGALATPGYIDNLDSNLNPYKYFADGLGADDNLWTFLDGTSDDGVFSAGSTNTRNYYLRFPTPTPDVQYGYAIVANWEAEDVHPSNAVEAVALNVDDNSTVYYVDNTTKGGNLILDVELFGWNYQPSTVKIESTVLSAVEEITAVPGSVPSTYEIDILADTVSGTEGNEYWVIAEYDGHDYTCYLTPPNGAPTDTLAAFFRCDLDVSNEAPPPPQEIIPWDEGPNAAFETTMTSSGGGVSAIDLGIRPNDGGVYLLWTTATASHGRAQRYNPDLTDEGSEMDLYESGLGIYDESNIVFGNSFLDCNEHEGEIALGTIIGPYYIFEITSVR